MVTELLEAYLDPANDNTPGARSVYGMYLHVLLADGLDGHERTATASSVADTPVWPGGMAGLPS